jgi:hypothetical protein
VAQPEPPVDEETALDPTLPGVLEAGEVDVDDRWHRVELNQSFLDPVVIAKPASFNDEDPVVVRIRNVDATGFEIRVQEWDYLDDVHDPETVGYLAIERGSHVLADGTRVEAGRFESDHTSSFKTVTLGQTYPTPPVVLTAITSFKGSDAVASRIRNIGTTSFQFQMQEQEANAKKHLTETVSYLAWEPSIGAWDGWLFEVDRTGETVTDQPHNIFFEQLFFEAPVFLADMQTLNGSDPANLRWTNKSVLDVDVQVFEEQSNDSETRHVDEAVGYILISP